ncbi:MAG: DUF2849 domain-containing protein [Asticcacaulis sp.]
MKLLTANRLSDGVVLWYAPTFTDAGGWVEDGALAARLEDDEAEALQKLWAARETVVVAPYLIPVTPDGKPVQREHVREYIRANGPTTGPTVFDTARHFNRSEIFE